MPAETSSKRPLTQLNLEIEQLEAEAARLEAERTTIVRDSRRGARQLSYLVLARWIRKPTSTFAMWPVALPLIGGGLIGFLLVIFVSIVTSSLAGALLAFLVGLGAGAAFLAHILHRPQNSILPTAIAESLSHYTWLTGDPESLNRLYALYDKVSAADLKLVAQKYFLDTSLTIGTISAGTEGGVK